MKRNYIQVILRQPFALEAGAARLDNEDDVGITSIEEARAYKGSTFEEDDEGCKDLHIVYQGGMACINFINEDGVRVNYDYPTDTIGRIKTL